MLDEYAIVFYALLDQAYKWLSIEQQMSLQISAFPHMEQADRQTLVNSLEIGSRDIVELLANDDDYEGLHQLKGILNG